MGHLCFTKQKLFVKHITIQGSSGQLLTNQENIHNICALKEFAVYSMDDRLWQGFFSVSVVYFALTPRYEIIS